MSGSTRSVAVAVIVALFFTSIRGFAQEAPATPPPQAPAAGGEGSAATLAELKRQANEAMATLRPADALPAYRQAYALSKEPAILYNMGRALEALEDYPGALVQYEEFRRTAPADIKARVPLLDQLIAQTRNKVTRVSFVCNVPGARVLVGAKAIGTISAPAGTASPLEVSLNAGLAHVEIDAEGYSPYVHDAQFLGGGILRIEVELIPKDRAGVLVVTTTPAAAEVAIDRKWLGVAPLEASVQAGMHSVAVRREGFRTTESSVVVAAHERKSLRIALEGTPVTARWWFWTGVAVVVVGGVVATSLALTLERSPDVGTIAPGLQHVNSAVVHF
jgi:hypothetical protein